MGGAALGSLLVLLLVVVAGVVVVWRRLRRSRPAEDAAVREGTTPTPKAGTGRCPVCFGSGRVNCPWCNGIGSKSCTQCGGAGQKFTGPSALNPSGMTRCMACAGGRMTCTCGGGRVVCGACGGFGKQPNAAG